MSIASLIALANVGSTMAQPVTRRAVSGYCDEGEGGPVRAAIDGFDDGNGWQRRHVSDGG